MNLKYVFLVKEVSLNYSTKNITFWKIQNCGVSEKMTGSQEGGGLNRQIFRQ